MPGTKEYRAFILDNAGHVAGRHEFEAEDDVQALQIAQRKYVNGHDIEVWELGRVVGTLKRKD